MNIPVSSFCDRYTTVIPKSQSGNYNIASLSSVVQRYTPY